MKKDITFKDYRKERMEPGDANYIYNSFFYRYNDYLPPLTVQRNLYYNSDLEDYLNNLSEEEVIEASTY